jgi:hypothetical protein
MELSNNYIYEVNDAPFYFMALKPNQPALNYLGNWSILDITAGTMVPYLNSFFYIDSLLKINEFHSLEVCSDFIACPDDSIDTLDVVFYCGWSCNSYPSNLDSLSNVCGLDSIVVKIVPGGISTIVEGDVDSPGSFSLCDTFSINTYYQVTGGIALPHNFTISSVPNGLTVAGIEVASATSAYVFIPNSNGNLNFPITTSLLNSIGLTSALSINQQLKVKIDLIATCSYVNQIGSLPDWSLFATNYCGDTLNYNAGNRIMSLIWDGISHCDSCITVTKTASSNYFLR